MEDPTAPSIWRHRFVLFRTGLKHAAPFTGGVLAALLAIWLYSLLNPPPHQLTTQEVDQTVAETLASATPPPPYSTLVYQIIQPSLVYIQTQFTGEDGEPDGGLGSDVLIDISGDILTSLHVVAGATDIEVVFADGTHTTAQVIASQPENDIAVLQATELPGVLIPATLGNPRAMRVGDEAYAVGNPFGLYSSMSAGVISGFDRTFQPPDSEIELQGLIQIDAAVNPGNSGGPLLNRYGQVIGIVTGIVNPTSQSFFVGIGFAVPINIAGAAAGLPPY
jgi:S1-C subfamily serine protease